VYIIVLLEFSFILCSYYHTWKGGPLNVFKQSLVGHELEKG